MAPSNSTKTRSTTRRPKSQRAGSSKSGPGVQKLKSSIRQTKRLLARENLAANLRVETERRLQSLETDLAVAEKSKTERTFAIRYHKVKFFERQKVCRKIQQAKRSLEDPSTTKSIRKDLEKKLKEHQVDLNYILHFPKTQKYISLFPSDKPEGEASVEPSETDRKRHDIRERIRIAMDSGELDVEPERTMNKEDGWDANMGGGDEQHPSASAGPRATKNGTKKGRISQRDPPAISGSNHAKIQEDDFFDEGDSD